MTGVQTCALPILQRYLPQTRTWENLRMPTWLDEIYFWMSVATLIGFNYGANLSLFPSFTKDLWGLKNFGMNYGVLFTAWGVGGFVLSRLQAMLFVASKDAAGKGSYQSSFVTAGILLMVGAALTFLIKSPTAQAKTS